MASGDLEDLTRRSAISVIGDVESVGSSTVSGIPVDDRTVVVRVANVLHAPVAFQHLAGQSVTVQLAADHDRLEAGARVALFGQSLAFSDGIALSEVGRLPAAEVETELAGAADNQGRTSMAALQARIESEQLSAHAEEALAVVVGRVVQLEKVGDTSPAEHNPDIWCAHIDVHHVERGEAPENPLPVLYANSLDVRWHACPKPRAGQDGLWILHAAEAPLDALGTWYLADAQDYQPVQRLADLRGEGQERPS